jgi:1,4-dihydroxy-2-naphthoyl-CoA hydrolase
MIWKNKPTIEALNMLSAKTINEALGIEFTEAGDDYLTARMPVDKRTKQPMGLLHGGASVVLAETLGSVASTLLIEDISKESAVGLEINANHLRAVKSGYVYGTVTAIKIGRRTHIWQIRIRNEEGKDSCISRLTCMIVQHG